MNRPRSWLTKADCASVDAVVAALAAGRPDPVVVTAVPDDLAALAGHAARPVTIVPV
jgi:hypothetical protein